MDHKQGWASGAMRRNAFAFLTRQERRKYEIARELGLDPLSICQEDTGSELLAGETKTGGKA